MLKLEWFDEAEADLHLILDYISDDNPEAAYNFRQELLEKIKTLCEHPKMYKAGRIQGTREMPVKRNYIVVYMADESTVSIIRVLHAAQLWPVTN